MEKTLTHAQFMFKSADGILRSRARTNRFHLKNSLFLLCVVTHNRKLEKRTILRHLLTLTFELKKVCRHFGQKTISERNFTQILFQNNKWIFFTSKYLLKQIYKKGAAKLIMLICGFVSRVTKVNMVLKECWKNRWRTVKKDPQKFEFLTFFSNLKRLIVVW